MACDRSLLPGLGVGAAVVAALLVLPPAVDVVESADPRRAALLALVLAAAAAPSSAVVATRRQQTWVAAGSGAVLVAAAALATWQLGPAWHNLWLVLAILVGGLVGTGLLGSRAGMAGVAVVTLGAGAVVAAAPDPAGEPWAVMLTVALAGASTIVLARLLATIDELRATRRELADQAVLAERDRFARDLHDLLGHSLSLVVVKSQVVRRLAGADPAAAAAHADDITGIGRRALAEVRQAVAGVHGTTLAGELTRARRALADAGITVDVDTTGAASALPERVDQAFAWVVREGATNVLRHSGAGHCTLRVEVDPGPATPGAPGRRTARLTITDDGAGRDGPLLEGHGLRGLRSRLAGVGGDLLLLRDLDSCRLTATAPVGGP